MAEGILKDREKTVAAIISRNEGKASLVVAVSADATAVTMLLILSAPGLRHWATRGGGRADMAQAGGPDGDAADAAMDAIARHWQLRPSSGPFNRFRKSRLETGGFFHVVIQCIEEFIGGLEWLIVADQLARSFVILPASTVLTQTSSSVWAKLARSALSSNLAR